MANGNFNYISATEKEFAVSAADMRPQGNKIVRMPRCIKAQNCYWLQYFTQQANKKQQQKNTTTLNSNNWEMFFVHASKERDAKKIVKGHNKAYFARAIR